MSNVINWFERDIDTGTWVEHTAQNQPELDVTYEVNNTELSGFTSLYNTGIQEGTTLPARGGSSNGAQHEYTFNNGYIWPYVFRRNTNNIHYFKEPSTLENKVIIRFNATPVIQLLTRFGGSRYSTDEQLLASDDAVIFRTDTLEARLNSFSVRGNDTRTYYRLSERLDPQTQSYVKYWEEDSGGIFWLSCEVKVIDRINGTFKIIPLIARNVPYGYSDVYYPFIYVTFVVLNNFNPKYSYDDGEIYNTKVIQKYNDEYRYDNQEGQFIYPIFFMGSGNFVTTFYNNDYHIQSFRYLNLNDWSPYLNLLQDMFAHINVNNGFAINYAPDVYLHNDWPEPQQNVTVPGSTVVDSCRDMVLDYYYVPVSYNNNSGSYEYYISGITLGEIPPEPEPEPDVPVEKPDFDPDVNYPETPEDVQNLPTPETPQDNSELLDYLKGYIDGQLRQGNFENEEQTPGQLVEQINGKDISWVNQAHGFTTACYVGSPGTIAELVDEIFELKDSPLMQANLLFSKNWDPKAVIKRILEFPFSTNFMGNQLTLIDGAPVWNNTVLTWQPYYLHNFTDEFLTIGASLLGLKLQEYKDLMNDYGIQPMSQYITIPGLTVPKYYKVAQKRFFEVNYGSVTINKIFGSFLDYTDVKYKIQLPVSNEVIDLDNNILFQDYTGDERDTGIVISMTGVCDIETGDMLLSITRNSDLIYQTTINVAVDRNLYTEDNTPAVKAIAQGLYKVAQGAYLSKSPYASANAVGQSTSLKTKTDGSDNPLVKVKEEGTSKTDYERFSSFKSGSLIIDGTLEAASGLASMGAPVQVGIGTNEGSTKLLGNQFPILIYDYPEIMIPKQGPYSNPGPWDYDFNYYDEVGLPAATTKVGKGYNKYGVISNIDINWVYSWSHEEIQGFKEDLLKGFYIYDDDHIYRSPGEVYTELFDNPDRFIYSPEPPGYIQGQGMSQGYEVTNSIVLINVFSKWEKYIDRFHPDNLQYSIQGGHYYICYDCNVYRDMNIDKPVIDISSQIYTHQNTAIWNGRIYRVVNVDYLPGHIVRLYLQEDYITTWYYFGVVQGIITRSTSYGISNMPDSLPRTVRRIVKRQKFTGGLIDADLGSTMIAVAEPKYATPTP